MLELNRVYPERLLDVRGHLQRLPEPAGRAAQRPGELPGVPRQPRAARGRVAAARAPRRARTRRRPAIDEAGRLIERAGRRSRARTGRATAGIALHRRRAQDQPLVVAEGVTKRVRRADDPDAGSTCRSRRGRGSGCSAPTAAARPRCSACSPASSRPTRATIESRRRPAHRRLRPAPRRGSIPTLTLRRALAPDGDSVIYQGRAVHVAGWAKRFLFRARAARDAGRRACRAASRRGC